MSSNMYRETTMDPARARHLQVLWDSRVKKLAKQTAFSEYELQCLCLIFHKLCETFEWWGKGLRKRPRPGRGAGRSGRRRGGSQDERPDRVDRLDRQGFRDGTSALMDMPDSTALDALFGAMDLDNTRYVTAARWTRALSALNGTNVEKALMCWRAYTRGNGGQVTRADMAARVRGMFIDVGQDDFDGFCKEFVDMMLKGTRAFKEGYMPLPEYMDIISTHPLFMEFLMTVLPSRDAMHTFLATFSPLTPKRRTRSRPLRGRVDSRLTTNSSRTYPGSGSVAGTLSYSKRSQASSWSET